MTTKKILITSALPYANGPLHFGHIAGAYLPADCFARFSRLQGNDVLYICGSDEYGVAITLSAEVAGRTPREHVDLYNETIKQLFSRLNFSFDHYSRTTWEGHVEPVQRFFLELLSNGYIEPRVTDQLYSEEDDRFLADRYVVGSCPKCGFDSARGDECQRCGAAYEATDLLEPRSKLTGAPLSLRPTKHWFLLLEKFQQQLEEWVERRDWKSNVVNFVKGYIDDLRPRAITRDSEWGVPVPLDGAEGKVLYVWFDAPIGYISSTMEWAQEQGDPDRWKEYWFDPDTHLVNFIGKDNIPFHAVIFPAMIMGQNQPFKLVDDLPANEFYNLEGRPFSKSDHWTIDLEDFFSHFSTDQIRYTIAANAPETSDSEFTWKDFQGRCNSELLGKLGNFVNRVMVFAHKRCDGRVPAKEGFEELDAQFMTAVNHCMEEGADCFQGYHLRKACQKLMELAQECNTYFDHKAPWKDAKNPELITRMEATIACCLDGMKALAVFAAPIIPETSQKIWQMLNIPETIEELGWAGALDLQLEAGHQLQKPEILFHKVEDEQIEQRIQALAAGVKSS